MDHLGLLDQVLNADVFRSGGWQVGEMTHSWLNRTVVTHYANTLLDISGEGILVGLHGLTNTPDFSVQVDGGPIARVNTNGFAALFIPFKTSCVVKTTSSPSPNYYAIAWLGAGDRWSDYTAVFSNTGVHEANTLVDLSGSGVYVLPGTVSTSTTIGIELDNSGVVWSIQVSGESSRSLLIPFKTRLRVTCSDTTAHPQLILLD